MYHFNSAILSGFRCAPASSDVGGVTGGGAAKGARFAVEGTACAHAIDVPSTNDTATTDITIKYFTTFLTSQGSARKQSSDTLGTTDNLGWAGLSRFQLREVLRAS